jgi:hypothetical protein
MVHASDQNGLLVITQVQPIAVLFTIPEDELPPVLTGRAPMSIVNPAFRGVIPAR